MFGIAKGTLGIKDGIDTIQVTTSMIKTEKSLSLNPMHDKVAVLINSYSPSASCNMIGRMYDDDRRDPRKDGLKDIKCPTEFFCNILIARGVEKECLDSCEFIFHDTNIFISQ